MRFAPTDQPPWFRFFPSTASVAPGLAFVVPFVPFICRYAPASFSGPFV